MAGKLKISEELSADDLRAWARRCGKGRAGARAYAIANALEGMSRAEAARLAGMERQALRDAVVQYNAEGVKGTSKNREIDPSHNRNPLKNMDTVPTEQEFFEAPLRDCSTARKDIVSPG